MRSNTYIGILIFFIGLSQLTWAQGLVFDDDHYDNTPRQAIFGSGNKSEIDAIKGISKKSLKNFCPKVEHQGYVSTCVGWSSGYSALTIQRAIQKKWSDQKKITDQAYSALFIFNQIKITDCGFGSRIGDAMQLLKDRGNVLSKYYDTDKEDCHKHIEESDFKIAKEHRIKDFVTLFGSKDDSQLKINKTKLSLIQNKPVVIGMSLLNNFIKIPYRDSIWYPAIGDKGSFGGHAMVVIGYDDGLGAFEIMNSWGDTWANHGFVWVKYKDFAEYGKYAYQMIVDETADFTPVYSAKVLIKKKVAQLTDGTILFKDLVPKFNGDYYFLDKPLGNGSIIQLKLDELSKGAYLYAFSIDPEGELKVHWPRDGNLDQAYTGKHESALIHIDKATLMLPSEESAFLFDKSGKDYLYIIYSTKPLENINVLLNQVQKSSIHPIEQIHLLFGQNLLTPQEINFSQQGMGFNTSIEDGKMVGMLLELDVE